MEKDLSVYEYAQLVALEDPRQYRDIATWRRRLDQVKTETHFPTGLPMGDGEVEFVGMSKNKLTFRVYQVAHGYLYKVKGRGSSTRKMDWVTHRIYMDLAEYPMKITFKEEDSPPEFIKTLGLENDELVRQPEMLKKLGFMGNSIVPDGARRAIVDYAREEVTHYNQSQPTSSFVLNLTAAKIPDEKQKQTTTKKKPTFDDMDFSQQ